jgi:uncharacterized protein YkwD
MGLLAISMIIIVAQPIRAATGYLNWAAWNGVFECPRVRGDENLAAEARAMFRMINRARVAYGLPQLAWDPELNELAKAKSQDMVCYNYFGHLSERLGSVYDQLHDKGILYRVVGENLVGAPGYQRAQQSVMDSPAHRGNILNADFNRIGIGVAVGGAYRKIFTQIFIN